MTTLLVFLVAGGAGWLAGRILAGFWRNRDAGPR